MTYDLGIIKRQRYNPIGSTATTGAITTSFNQNGVNYTAHIFTTTGTLLLSTGVIAEYLIVAGGGAGGGAGTDGAAGGGGGGGVTTGTVGLVPNVSYTIAVGQGGVGRSDNTGTVAGNSSISGSGISIVALGGGWGSAKGLFAGAGGSGGGGHQVQSTGGAAGVGTFSSGGGPNTATNYVNAGGASAGNVSAYGSGGGGGAGAAGQAGTTTYGGSGGTGTFTTIISTTVGILLGIGQYITATNALYFAGGGGGSSFVATMGQGGFGGGGVAVNASGAGAIGSTGTQYTGGGGGAAYSGGATLFGGNGGSGVVIIRYPSFSTASIFSTVSSQALVLQPDSNFKYNSLLLSNLAPQSYQSPLPIEYLVVAGGGASGGIASGGTSGGLGGGGAGGFLSGINYLVSSGTYIVTVGAGGTGATAVGANGSNSVFDSITALGGGGGGGGISVTIVDGQVGGSGGGGGYTGVGGAGYSLGGRNQGNNGSAGTNVTPAFSGGGGGGAGAAAGASSSSAGGNGGAGKQWVDGNYYAGGGGGGSKAGTTAGTGGLGGGGAGVTTSAGIDGLPNTGGGGGGIVRLSLARNGMNGGSGIVIIRYSGTNILAYGGNTTTSGGYTIHTFTASGTILFSGYSPSTTSTLINSTLVDSSYNNNPVNFNGTLTQGTFSPYGQNWSTYFNSNLDSLQIPTSTGTSLDLTSSTFTIEAWINVTSLTSQSYIAGVSNSVATSNTSTFDWSFFVTTGTGAISYQSAKGSSSLLVTGGTITTSTWNHVAVSRVGSTATVFVNGIGTTGAVNTITNTNTNIFSIGRLGSFNRRLFNGYISNFRVVKGVTVYATNTNFTPPTSPLPLLTNTVLLACSSNRFIDVSGTTSSFITSGTVSVSRYTPFSPLGTYNKSYNGSSVYLNGSTNYLTTYSPSGFLFGTNDFTVESWIYLNTAATNGDSSTDKVVFGGFNFTPAFLCFINNSTIYRASIWDGSNQYNSTITILPKTWTHVAWVRQSSILNIYTNGVSGYTNASYTTNWTVSTTAYIGRSDSSDDRYFPGYISNLRIVNGVAVYTGNFTPLTTPLLTIDTSTSTSLLLKFDNASIIDYSGNSTVIPYTTATISNSQTKFNPYSMYFNGTSNLQIPSGSNPSLNLSTGDFTIEAWIYSTSLQTDNACIISNGAGGGFSFGFTGSGLSLGWGIGSISDYSFAHGMSLNTWYHVALTRNSTNMRMFVNGTQIGVTQSISKAYDLSGISGTNPTIGSYDPSLYFFVGYIDDLRVTRGIARYTANFGPLANRLQIR